MTTGPLCVAGVGPTVSLDAAVLEVGLDAETADVVEAAIVATCLDVVIVLALITV